MISIKNLEDNEIELSFNGSEIKLTVVFVKTTFGPQTFMAFKGLLHSQPILNYQTSLTLDRGELLSLVYSDGQVHFQMGQSGSQLVLPVKREAYHHLDHLLNQFQ